MTRPLRVGFNARLLASETLRGWNRYLVSLLAELPALGVEPFLYSHQPLHERHLRNLPRGAYQVRVSKPMTYLAWQEYWLPRQCRQDALDIFHSPFHFGLPCRANCACVLTLHDTFGLDALAPLLSPHVWAYHAMARARADHIVTVSKYSRAAIMREYSVPKSEDYRATYEAAQRAFSRDVARSTGCNAALRPVLWRLGRTQEPSVLGPRLRGNSCPRTPTHTGRRQRCGKSSHRQSGGWFGDWRTGSPAGCSRRRGFCRDYKRGSLGKSFSRIPAAAKASVCRCARPWLLAVQCWLPAPPAFPKYSATVAPPFLSMTRGN